MKARIEGCTASKNVIGSDTGSLSAVRAIEWVLSSLQGRIIVLEITLCHAVVKLTESVGL